MRHSECPAGLANEFPISVIVPARNEEEDLEEAVQSILDQVGVQVQVVIVNDHSTDRTGEISNQLARVDERVTVIHDPPLSAGWFGKVNAMQTGLQFAKHDFILFTDADVMHAPTCFAWTLEQLLKDELDLFSLAPYFELESFWENVILPHTLIAGTVQFLMQNVNDPTSKNGAAAGALMLMNRQGLEKIGGLASIRNCFLDDVELAKQFKRHDMDARIMFVPDLLRVRLFKSNTGAFWGLTKNILGAVDNIAMAVPAMFLPIFAYWIPIATGVIGAVTGNRLMLGSGISTYLIQASLLLLCRPMMRLQWYKAVLFPLAAIPVFCCFAKAIYHRLRSHSVSWRGRVISMTDS